MDALVDEQTQFVDEPVIDRQPVQFIAKRVRDVVVLLLLYNKACYGVKFELKWLEVGGTRGAKNAVAVVYVTDDKCVDGSKLAKLVKALTR